MMKGQLISTEEEEHAVMTFLRVIAMKERLYFSNDMSNGRRVS